MPTQQDVWHRSNCRLDIWGFESRRASWCFVWRDPMSSGPHQGLSPNYKSYIESDWDSQRWWIQCIQSLLWLKVCTASQLSPLFEQRKLRSNSKVVGDMGGRCNTNTWTHQWWSATSSALGRSCLDKMQPPWQEALSWQSFVVQPDSFCSSLYDEKNAKQDMTISCPDCTSLYAATQSDLLSSFSF